MAGCEESTEQKDSVNPGHPGEEVQGLQVQPDGGGEEQAHVNCTISEPAMASTEEAVTDPPLDTVVLSEDTAPSAAASAANGSAVAMDGILAVGAAEAEPSANSDGADEELPEISADSIAAAAAGSMAADMQKPKGPPATPEGCDAAVPKQASSDMPPPSFLPRQLRLKRTGFLSFHRSHSLLLLLHSPCFAGLLKGLRIAQTFVCCVCRK